MEGGGCNIKAIYISALDARATWQEDGDGGRGRGGVYILSISRGWMDVWIFWEFSVIVNSNIMKSTTIISLIAALAAQQVTGHATFQDLWVNGVDEISPALPPLSTLS
jgi:hypothetical protein